MLLVSLRLPRVAGKACAAFEDDEATCLLCGLPKQTTNETNRLELYTFPEEEKKKEKSQLTLLRISAIRAVRALASALAFSE